jgi:hypothetical protein
MRQSWTCDNRFAGYSIVELPFTQDDARQAGDRPYGARDGAHYVRNGSYADASRQTETTATHNDASGAG